MYDDFQVNVAMPACRVHRLEADTRRLLGRPAKVTNCVELFASKS